MATQKKRKKHWAQKRRQQLVRRCLLFVGCVLIALGLFFGGRAIWQLLSKRPSAENKSTEQAAEEAEKTIGDTAVRKTISAEKAGQIGWNMTNAGWWYQEDAGTQVADGWKTIEGKRYYFLPDGYMATGWTVADGVDTYFDSDGGADMTRSQKRVALTFEDGPSELTKEIFDTLSRYHAHATFFVVGQNRAENEKELVKALFDAGHEIGNHSYDHTTLSLASYEEVIGTIEQNDALIESITGVRPALLRPTSTTVSDTMNAAVTKPMIFWDIAAGDWKSADAEGIAEQILGAVQDGSIVQLHDLPAMHGEVTAEVVAIIVPKLQKMGYRLMTVSEMAQSCGYTLEAKTQYRNFYPENAPTAEAAEAAPEENNAGSEGA